MRFGAGFGEIFPGNFVQVFERNSERTTQEDVDRCGGFYFHFPETPFSIFAGSS